MLGAVKSRHRQKTKMEDVVDRSVCICQRKGREIIKNLRGRLLYVISIHNVICDSEFEREREMRLTRRAEPSKYAR